MSLAERLRARIAAEGPMDLSAYMAACTAHYYGTRDPLGAAGDFTTAPEIHQMFGEVIGAALAQWWREAGRPLPLRYVELGPGRGTLAADALRVLARVGEAEVHLVETSPALRRAQTAALPGAIHHARLDAVPEGPMLLVANEFFDALPVRAFQRVDDMWRARTVEAREGALLFGQAPPAPEPALAHRLADTPDGRTVETRPAADAVMAEIARRLASAPGAALVIDYGDRRSLGDTLQALRGHAPEDPLARPGEADLTAHVDFDALERAAPGIPTSETTPQGVFLERLGLTARAQALHDAGDTTAAAAHRRLVHPDAMGALFKAQAWTSPGMPALPGLPLAARPGDEGA